MFATRIVLSVLLTGILSVTSAQDTTRLSLLFLGDIMQHGSQIEDAYDARTKKHNYEPCFQFVKPYTQAVDLAIGNLELTLAGPPYSGYPQFSSPDELAVALKNIGMDVLVTANNHCVDTGKKGLERTIRVLDSLKILHTGTFVNEAEKKKLNPLMLEKNGFRLALLNYTFSTNGLPVYKPNIVNMMDTVAMGKDLTLAKSLKPDAIVVFIHWGIEYQSLPAVREKKVTEFCFRNGAQLVIGAHPHVLQPMEWRKKDNQLVVYSLGNFVSGQRKRYTDGGGMIRVELEKVKVNDTLSYTGIDTAGYILEWVYRTPDAEKNYYVLPVPTVEADSMKFIRGLTSKEAYTTFVSDSRALFAKHNKNVTEYNSAPAYHVVVSAQQLDTVKLRDVVVPDHAIKVTTDNTRQEVSIGPFTMPDARHVLYTLNRRMKLAGRIESAHQ